MTRADLAVLVVFGVLLGLFAVGLTAGVYDLH